MSLLSSEIKGLILGIIINRYRCCRNNRSRVGQNRFERTIRGSRISKCQLSLTCMTSLLVRGKEKMPMALIP